MELPYIIEINVLDVWQYLPSPLLLSGQWKQIWWESGGMISADGFVVEGVGHTSPPVLRVGLNGLSLCSGFGSCSCRCPIQAFSGNSTFPDVQQDENIPCRSLQTGSAREQQKLNIYFSPAICASSAVLHKRKNIVKFYCCSKPTMYTNPELAQYLFLLKCHVHGILPN